MSFSALSPAFLVAARLPVRHSLAAHRICQRRCRLTHTLPLHFVPLFSVPSASATSSASSPSPSEKSEESTTLVIVESPAKAATIQSILPQSQFRVRSCVGHIREIPSSAKRIPPRYKTFPWARLGVDVENEFRPIYVLISGKQPVLTELRSELRSASRLVLATDDDREGEAISWHLLEALKPTVPVHRAVFHEITPQAINAAFNSFRDLNMALVSAQETRRVLDRLAGYTMSPLLWTKIARGLSAGRVQSVAMSVIVRRETARLLFVPVQFSTVSATFTTADGILSSTLAAIDGRRVTRGTDFHQRTGGLNDNVDPDAVVWLDSPTADALSVAITASTPIVDAVVCRRTTRNPPLPLITSTLQQECGNRLGMGAGKTMQVAQRLYETGLITYMRTDNPVLSDDAVSAARATISRLYGEEYLWSGDGQSRVPKTKSKAVQAAHEAIRPAGTTFVTPDELSDVSDEEKAVYAIIFNRALASQMTSAKLDQTTVKVVLKIPAHNDNPEKSLEFRATGSVIVEPGFLQLSRDSGTDTDTFLPSVSKGDELQVIHSDTVNHETKPPPRYNDASLVKELEERGVGRPSTYAGIIEKLILRGYVYRGSMLPEEKKVPPKALVPSLTAFAVEKLLSTHFSSFVDADFTARMEQALDEIASGSADRVKYLRAYYCGDDGLEAAVKRSEDTIDASVFRRIVLPNMPKEMLASISEEDKALVRSKAKGKKGSGEKRSKARRREEDAPITLDWAKTRVLISSYGPYIEQNGVVVASLPKTTLADDLTAEKLENVLQLADDPVLGRDEESGLDVLLRTSRFGPYIQLGRDGEAGEGQKPKRCGLLPGMDVGDVTLELALKLLSLPRLLGNHPKSGLGVRVAMGPYGPYVMHGESSVSLKRDEHDVLEIGLNEAVAIIDAAELRKQLRLEKQAEKRALAEAAKAESAEKPKTKGKPTRRTSTVRTKTRTSRTSTSTRATKTPRTRKTAAPVAQKVANT